MTAKIVIISVNLHPPFVLLFAAHFSRGFMKLHNLRLRGLTEAFPNEVRVDFDALGPGLIALVGENGAGKSTLIGSVFAALFRQLPWQKRSLYDFCTHPETENELPSRVNCSRY